jgi:hypothetical protein
LPLIIDLIDDGKAIIGSIPKARNRALLKFGSFLFHLAISHLFQMFQGKPLVFSLHITRRERIAVEQKIKRIKLRGWKREVKKENFFRRDEVKLSMRVAKGKAITRGIRLGGNKIPSRKIIKFTKRKADSFGFLK